ncbi:MAG TPA: helix-turn-helix transcriptional regulator [Acidimicrobiales bacterium]|nr:helix-turn-helix transcriptional regulator [Acidimicrobiales bacterium]
MQQAIEAAREACAGRRWGDGRRLLEGLPFADLGVDDLDRLGTCAWLTGEVDDAAAAWVRAHQVCVADGSVHRAAYFGIRLAQCLAFAGDVPRCRGWVDRTAQLLDAAGIDCVEQGYLDLALGLCRIFEAGDVAGAQAQFGRAGKVAARFGDRELLTLAAIGEGRMLVYLGDVAEGMALLDGAMVAMEAGELSVLSTGDAYCTVIDACSELYDVVRCRAWTRSFARWCDDQQELVLYRGHCLVHRAETLAVDGAWGEARAEARRAADRLARPIQPAALAAARLLEADLLRLAGDLPRAEDAYQEAHALGREPQPGLALLRLAQGRADTAATMIGRVLAETEGPVFRARMLDAAVEIALAAGDRAAAAAAAGELREVAAQLGTALLRAQAARAEGAVLLAAGDAAGALAALRRAFREFHELGVPYDAARTRLLVAGACAALGDADAAAMETDTGREALAALRALCSVADDAAPDGLTQRELEVLRLLARGKTNRVIGQELFISEKTVATHVGHIFTKLGVASRAGATAYAYDRGLV